MGDHFTSLAEKQEAAQSEPATKARAAKTPEERKAEEVAEGAMADPEVRQIVADPRIQTLLRGIQSGQPIELEHASRTDPDVVRKLKKLSDAGLIGMEWK